MYYSKCPMARRATVKISHGTQGYSQKPQDVKMPNRIPCHLFEHGHPQSLQAFLGTELKTR